MSSFELQYITELGGQQLLPVFDGHISLSKRLQLLRDKAHAWFQFNFHAHSFQTVSIEEQFHDVTISLVDGHFCLWHLETEDSENWAKIVPILPKPSEQTVKRHWPPESLCPVPDAYIVDVYMDPAQNLIAIAYGVNNDTFQEGRFYVDLRTLDGDGIHPQAAGQTLFLSAHTAQDNHDLLTVTEDLKLKGLGRHLALQCCPVFNDVVSTPRVPWWVQLWDS